MLILSFLDYLRYERNSSDKTVSAYEVDLIQFREFLDDLGFEADFFELSSDVVRMWMVELMDKGYTATSVNRKLSALRSFYKYLIKQGRVEVDPLRRIVGPKMKRPLPAFLKEKEMNNLLNEVEFGSDFGGCRDHLIIEMFYATGMRLSELIGLDDCDVDFCLNLIKVTGKRDKERLIPFGERLRDEMLKYVELRDSMVSRCSDAFFVIERNGERLYANLVYGLVKRNLSKVSTLKKKSPHVLRHTFATVMLNHQAELEAVKDLLGHESLATTQIYTHTTFEELKKEYKRAHPRA
ncbi:MAG: tyrosine recombinase XerC [Bacteroides sp.]